MPTKTAPNDSAALNRLQAATFVTRRCAHPVAVSVLAYWEGRGLLRRQTPGRRVPARYTVADLVRAEAVARLRRDGASLQRVRRAVRELARLLPGILERPGDWRLAVTGRGDVVRLEGPDVLLQLTKQPGQLAILDAGAMVEAARVAVEGRNRRAG